MSDLVMPMCWPCCFLESASHHVAATFLFAVPAGLGLVRSVSVGFKPYDLLVHFLWTVGSTWPRLDTRADPSGHISNVFGRDNQISIF